MFRVLFSSIAIVFVSLSLNAQCTFTNPIKTGAADPQITYIDGYYYFLYTTGDGVWLRRHQNMHEVGNDAVNGAKKVWGWNSEIVGHVWAPEIHKINGKFYIYASGSVTGNNNPESMRMFVLEANSTDPFGTYTYKGLLSNNYAIDQSIWQDPETSDIYMTYSQWDQNIPMATPADWIQCTYICKMISPTQMGTGVRLSYPEYNWEKHAWWVNEGQYFLKKGNKLHIIFSVSGCAAAEYSLAMLTCSNGDYLNPAAWTKSTAPVFTQDPSKSVYGTGHHSTVQTPNGEWWLVYHAVSSSAGACDGTRSTRMQPFTFDANDNPVFGTPVATGVALTCPGSMTPPNYWNFTSDLEGWTLTNQISANINNSIATLSISGNDPYMHSPDNLNISATDYKYVVVSMKNNTNSTNAELFWTKFSDGAYSSYKVDFSISPNDTKQRYYIIDLSANANWNGTIKQLRLDPTTMVTSGTVEIDFIKFVGSYQSALAAIPGTLEAEDFNKGGQDNAYNDADIANAGGAYRTTEGVDIETTGDATGTYNVGWVAAGEWMEYLVTVSQSGTYNASVRAAAPGDGAAIELYCDGDLLSTFTLTNSGAWQTYANTLAQVQLTQGKHILKIRAKTSGYNLNAINFEKYTPTISPYTQINGGTWEQTNTATLCTGETVSFGPHPIVATGWTWTGPNGFTANTRQIILSAIEANKAGNYVATYTDANGNSNTQDFTLTVNPSPSASITLSNETCEQSNGSITLTFDDVSGRSSIAFSIDGGLTYPVKVNDNTGTYEFTGLAPGDYNVWSSWGNQDCPVDLGTHTINTDLLPKVTIVATKETCEQANGSLKLSYTDNPSRVNIRFSIDGGLTYPAYVNDNTGTYEFTGLAPGDYNVWSSWGNQDCPVDLGIYTVNADPLPTATVTTSLSSVELANGSITFSFTDNPARTNIAFSIDNGVTYTSVADNSGTKTYSNLAAGTYQLWTRWGNEDCPVFLGEYIITANQTILLQQGWNLISTQVHPADSTIETLFNGLDVAMVKDANGFWKKDQVSAFNSLKTITAGNGYLVYMNTVGTLSIKGTPLNINNLSLTIKNGWNLIGCPFITTTPFSKEYNSTNCQTIKNFDGFWQPNGTLNSIENFEVGKGYYIKK
jgi:GH43 family beta-xylosidase